MRKLLFFHATWCGPCRAYNREIITPLENQIGSEYIERIDAWKEPWRAEKYHVERLPTVALLDGDTVKLNHTGTIDIDKVAEWLQERGDAID